MKRMAIFADGTWNSPEQGNPTNVLSMAQAVQPKVKDIDQVAFYDWGVGSDGNKISGGITGAGIDKNIMDCYRFIVHNYDPGDELYFFGFSRGAYTVRSLAGFIRNSGLLKREFANRIPDAYKLYRKRSRTSGPNQPEAIKFRQDYAVADITYINFVGVWDTVGALGIPIPFWGTLGEREFLFHDTEPSKIILRARHAVSIDENRKDFEPTLWSEKPELDLKQVWFAGVHSDIGGGYDQPGLSYCAAQWMIYEAEECGLIFEPHLKNTIQPDENGQQHNERKGIYLAREEHVRDISGPLHISVKQRWDANSDNYRSKSKALARLLEAAGNDWTKIQLTK
ncbi:DUF2235 domain-containing protein [Methylobacillus gramineus]|uniref:DUF2235 domain-containing protein n=1 Tax=Methylobacillus gramineus TaxID=755169 RepID=UPI001CFFF738|nr:DUF2235 domain-containing protein [Methylobacillus gramineus]MCB5185847.1 DUF2235 domain-containing protein [Methylobacillus gramineus]